MAKPHAAGEAAISETMCRVDDVPTIVQLGRADITVSCNPYREKLIKTLHQSGIEKSSPRFKCTPTT